MNPYAPIAGTRPPLLPAPISMPIAGTRPPLLPPRPKKKAAPSGTVRPPTSLLANLPTLLTDAQARDQVMALLAPIYAQQNAAINAAYDQRANAIRQAYAAAAQYAQGVAPAVQGIYQNASKDTAAFAKGFTDALSQGSGQAADAATAQIAAVGGPQTVTSGLENGGGAALYAMGGQIPATQLSREGAAFGSAASFLPTTAAQYGAQAVGENENQRIQDLLQAQADEPSTVLDMIGKLTDQSYNRRQDALNLGLNERDYQTKLQQTNREYADQQKAAKAAKVQQQWEAAALKQAYGYKLTPFEKRLLKTYGSTPDAVEAAGKAKTQAAEDQRRAAAAAADDRRARAATAAHDRAVTARQRAHDAAIATQKAKDRAARSGLEADKQRYRKALEAQKQANRRALEAQKQAGRLKLAAKKGTTKKKGKKTAVGNPGDSYFGE
jgi:hypothetical protein